MNESLELISDLGGFAPEQIAVIAKRAGLVRMSTVWKMVQEFETRPGEEVTVDLDSTNAWRIFRLLSALTIFTYTFATYEEFVLFDPEEKRLRNFSRSHEEAYYLDLALNYLAQLNWILDFFPEEIRPLPDFSLN